MLLSVLSDGTVDIPAGKQAVCGVSMPKYSLSGSRLLNRRASIAPLRAPLQTKSMMPLTCPCKALHATVTHGFNVPSVSSLIGGP